MCAQASVGVEVLQQHAAWQAHLHRCWWHLLGSSHVSQAGVRLWLCEDVCKTGCVLAMVPCGHSCMWSASIPEPRAHVSFHASVICICLLHWVLLPASQQSFPTALSVHVVEGRLCRMSRRDCGAAQRPWERHLRLAGLPIYYACECSKVLLQLPSVGPVSIAPAVFTAQRSFGSGGQCCRPSAPGRAGY
jgi:hypothetical protein